MKVQGLIEMSALHMDCEEAYLRCGPGGVGGRGGGGGGGGGDTARGRDDEHKLHHAAEHNKCLLMEKLTP